MLIRILLVRQLVHERGLVNCTPWSVLKISG